MNNIYYPDDFPSEEFNQKLEEITSKRPEEIKEKTLQDLVYDLLDKKDLLTGMFIYKIFNDNGWIGSIEKTLFLKRYCRSEINPGVFIPF